MSDTSIEVMKDACHKSNPFPGIVKLVLLNLCFKGCETIIREGKCNPDSTCGINPCTECSTWK